MKILLDESEKNRILGLHKKAKFINENELAPVAKEKEKVILKAKEKTKSLSDEEHEVLKNFIEDKGPNIFLNLVKQEVAAAQGEGEMTEDEEMGSESDAKLGDGKEKVSTDLSMSENERQVRAIIDRIINYSTVGSALGIVPAAMFVSGGVALGLGITSIVGLLLKDSAWWDTKKGGHAMHTKEMEKSRKDWHN